MRNKIDYGIDLGTTNSAIARMENGAPVIKKSPTLKDTFPSCVNFDKKGNTSVGDSAFNRMKTDNTGALKTFETGKTNTFIEFKRTMGTTHSYASSNMDRTYTPEELSAAVLKSLRSVITDDSFSSVVITIPAKFLSPQNDATIKAAKLAGFNQVQLVQEPVAAATAYKLLVKNCDGYLLVFDFGGGTFDAALVKCEEGIMSVKDTDGDNWLGGKNLDDAIVDQIIIPNLQKNYSIDSILKDSDKKEILRNAVKFKAEEAKIQLSFASSFRLMSDLGDLPFEDAEGNEPEIDVTLTEVELEKVIGPIFQKAVDKAKELLTRNNLKGADLRTVVLVGGPTFSPILRRMLKAQITENIDTSVDPMTIVARGAALFASTINISEEVKELSRDKTKLQLELKYPATSVETEEFFNLKILKDKTVGTFPEKVFAKISRSDGAWVSQKVEISEKASIVELLLQEGKANSFDISLYEDNGNTIECEPNQFSIIQGIGGLDSMQVLPYNIGLELFFPSEEKDLFAPIKGLEKNKTIPATGILNGLITRKDIHGGNAKDIIRIPIYQGDHAAEGTNPLFNNLVNVIEITGENLPGLLPKGSPVDLTFHLDKSQTMRIKAYFPLLDHTEELTVEIKPAETPEAAKLSSEIELAMASAQELNSISIKGQLVSLNSELDNKKGSADGRLRILDKLRELMLSLEKEEKKAEWPRTETDLKAAYFSVESLMEQIKADGFDTELNMDRVNAGMLEYKNSVARVIKERNTREGKFIIIDLNRFEFGIRYEIAGSAIDVQYLQEINRDFAEYSWLDPNNARQLVNQGLKLVTEGKTQDLKPIISKLIGLMPENKKPADTLELSR